MTSKELKTFVHDRMEEIENGERSALNYSERMEYCLLEDIQCAIAERLPKETIEQTLERAQQYAIGAVCEVMGELESQIIK